MPLDESLAGAPRRLRRAVGRVEKALRGPSVTAKDARAYGGCWRPPRSAGALDGHLVRTSLDADVHLWSAYFAQLPERLLPESFEVHRSLGHGAEAVRLADIPDRRTKALECCAASTRPATVYPPQVSR